MEQSAPPTAATQPEIIAERLEHLFAQYKQVHRRKATDQQVADHVRAETGKPCSRHWVRDLRNAANRAPDLNKLEAVAGFFGVPRGYLFDDRDTVTVDTTETARRANLLFTQFTESNGQPATNQQVADHVAAETEQPCTAQWIQDLREAKIRAPDPLQLEAVGSFFGVSRRYLYDNTVAVAVEQDIQTGLAIKKLEVNGIHLRQLSDFTADQLRLVRALVVELAAQTPPNNDQ